VLAFIRWVLRLFEKEHAALARYERSRPHFLWYLAFDAVISIAVVIGAFQFVVASSADTQSVVPLGVAPVSAADLVGNAISRNMDAFWLGPVSGYKYTLDVQESGIVDIFYWPRTSENFDGKAFLYEVKTYERQDVWTAHTHPIKANVDTTTILVNKNVSIRINKTSMKGVIATFADKPEIVAIAYPKPQTLSNMIKNVESLKLVR
jgi:hypothetical protein